MTLVFLGPPGCGKGTQALLLKEHHAFVHFPVGEMLKRAKDLDPNLSKSLNQGQLLNDDVVNGVVKKAMDSVKQNNILFDGFPRTIVQAEFLDAYLGLERKNKLKVFFFEITLDVLLSRTRGRLVCKDCGATYHVDNHPPLVFGKCNICGGDLVKRVDDSVDVFQERLRVYEACTRPLVDYYGNRIVYLDAGVSMQEVYKKIVANLGLSE